MTQEHVLSHFFVTLHRLSTFSGRSRYSLTHSFAGFDCARVETQSVLCVQVKVSQAVTSMMGYASLAGGFSLNLLPLQAGLACCSSHGGTGVRD